ncbi:cold-shock protein [Salipiger sp. PrR002]|uniref:cold-shock protein n=1 Tax=Salipiger sp. PrR002 TaxID=2706489 RepID=UPI0013B9BEA8|nr:cold shock domain-containing protein [Salipiger sp. PrR002]NDW00057.1 cold shock domain-containing protein [Salipiger sp. PrR002]NDW56934.1 cold shock domain-containing protein [Salipiger sp. PrR004]
MSEIAKCAAKRFRSERGYGFVTLPEGDDIFLHLSILRECGFEAPPQGATVEVEYRPSPKGLEAIRVLSIEGGTPEPEVPIPDHIVAARVKLFDFRRGFGFAIPFGYPGRDVFFSMDALDALPTAPAPGEAVVLVLEPGPRPRAARVLRWDQATHSGEALDVAS